MGFFSALFGSKSNNKTRKNGNRNGKSLFGTSTPNANATKKNNNAARRNVTIKAMNRATLSPLKQRVYNAYMRLNKSKKNIKNTNDKLALLESLIHKFRDPTMFGIKNYKKNDPSTWPYHAKNSEGQKKDREEVKQVFRDLGYAPYAEYVERIPANSDPNGEATQYLIKKLLNKVKKEYKNHKNNLISNSRSKNINGNMRTLAENLSP